MIQFHPMLRFYPSPREERENEFQPKKFLKSLKTDLEGDWKPLEVKGKLPERIAFVDGVRRTEYRVGIFEGSKFAGEGIFISIAAGSILIEREGNRFSYRLLSQRVERFFIHNTEGEFEEITFKTDSQRVVFKPLRSPIGDISLYANYVMKKMEVETLGEIYDKNLAVVMDGPVKVSKFFPNVAYLVKESGYYYLQGLEEILFKLREGWRTPLFLYEEPVKGLSKGGLKEIKLKKVGSYIKLSERGFGNPLHSLARLEFPFSKEIDSLKEAVNWASAVVFHFANDPLRDWRSPQNLTAIAFLEKELRRKLGEYRFIRRKLESAVF